jgi:hypothetical protein
MPRANLKKQPAPKRSIQIRVTEKEYRDVTTKAKASGQTAAEWSRLCVLAGLEPNSLPSLLIDLIAAERRTAASKGSGKKASDRRIAVAQPLASGMPPDSETSRLMSMLSLMLQLRQGSSAPNTAPKPVEAVDEQTSAPAHLLEEVPVVSVAAEESVSISVTQNLSSDPFDVATGPEASTPATIESAPASGEDWQEPAALANDSNQSIAAPEPCAGYPADTGSLDSWPPDSDRLPQEPAMQNGNGAPRTSRPQEEVVWFMQAESRQPQPQMQPRPMSASRDPYAMDVQQAEMYSWLLRRKSKEARSFLRLSPDEKDAYILQYRAYCNMSPEQQREFNDLPVSQRAAYVSCHRELVTGGELNLW